MKPYSESCEQNQAPIFMVLKEVFADRKVVLEIGSGTGQHAVYFGSRLPHLVWQTSDLLQNHAGIRAWLDEAQLPNVHAPFLVDANQPNSWHSPGVDAIFSANAVHIMSWSAVEGMFEGIGRILLPRGLLVLYGPFNYHGKFTSVSNQRFDAWLKEQNSQSGVRDFEAVDALAKNKGLVLDRDVAMPANNRMLVWRRE